MAFSLHRRFKGAIWAWVLVVVNASQAFAQDPFAGDPIPNGPQVKTNGVYREGFYRYYSQLTESYQAHTKDPEPIQQAGIEFLTAAIQARCLLAPDKVDLVELNRLGKAAIEAGSNDILVRQRYARLRAIDADFELARTVLLECDAALGESDYPAVVPMLNSYYLCSLARAAFDEDLFEAHFPRFLDHFARWLEQESKIPENRRYLFDLAYSLMSDFPAVPQKEAILQALEQGQIDAWVADVFTGAVEIDIAWEHRTAQVASNVSAGGWQGFAEHLQIANDHLQRAWQTQPDCPEAASLMISVATGGGTTESPRVWFDRAVTAEMDHPDAYRRLTNALLPRWGGSHRIMSRFGLECLATHRFDTLVPLHLFTQILNIEDETGRSDRYWRNPKVYAKLREMFEGYRQAPDLPELQELFVPRNRVLSWYAATAILAEQWEDARLAIDQVDGQLDANAMRGVHVGNFEVSHALALTGNVKELVLEAEQLEDQTSQAALEQAIEKLTAASQQNSDVRAAGYFPARARMLREQQNFQRGEWTPLTFDEDLSGWRQASGTWTRESDTAVIGTQSPLPGGEYYIPFALIRDHNFQPPYLFRADIEDLDGATASGVGVTIGDVAFDGMRESKGRFCFAHQGAVGVDRGMPDPTTAKSHSMAGMNWTERTYRMDIRVWSNSLLLLINDEGPWDMVTDSDFGPGSRFGLAGRCQGSKSRVRFSNVRVRRLPYASLALLSGHEQLVVEGNKMVEFDPDDWFARWLRGSSNFELARYEEALDDFLTLDRIQPNLPAADYMTGAVYAKTKHYAEAIGKFEVAAQANPPDPRVLRAWAELEMTAEDPQYLNLESALEHARRAEQSVSDPNTAWQYRLTIADAYAKLGDYTKALERVSSIGAVMDPAATQQITAKSAEFRKLKGNSYRSACASLLWEGDATTRILGIVLAAVLAAANLIVIGKVAKSGRLAGAATGAFGGAISLGVPSVLAILFGVGEGPAFIKLLAGIVGFAAIAGAISGLCLAAKKPPASPDPPPITAELLDAD